MKKKFMSISMILALSLGVAGCSNEDNESANIDGDAVENTETPVVEEFAAEYEMKGMTSAGEPKSDTFIFEGETEDSIITKLNFDIIRDKGTDDEISKKDLYGYQMNISDAVIEKSDDGFTLPQLTATGYDDAFEGGQYMITASTEQLEEDTTFGDLSFSELYSQEPIEFDQALAGYSYVAVEAGITDLSEDTLVKDILSAYDLYEDGSYVEGANRISFAGYNGGRSFGEQIDAIVSHIIQEEMTLEEVYEMFETVNSIDQPIDERDIVSGATITFVGDFQRIVYLAMHGELFEGVITDRPVDDNLRVEVSTQGYGGEIVTHVTFDDSGEIVDISIRDAQETADIGEELTQDDSDFINSIIENQDNLENVEVVSGATITSNSLIKAVELAKEYYEDLN